MVNLLRRKEEPAKTPAIVAVEDSPQARQDAALARNRAAAAPVKEEKEAPRQAPPAVKAQKLTNDKDEVITVGNVYQEKDGDAEVIPFFVDFGAARVLFAPVGRASEENVSTSDFVKRFKDTGSADSSLAEKKAPAKK